MCNWIITEIILYHKFSVFEFLILTFISAGLSVFIYILYAAAKSLQSCPTLCDPIDGSPPGSPVPGILQARTLEWLAISFSSAWKWKVKVKSLSRVWLLAIPWTTAYRAPPAMGFSRQEYGVGCHRLLRCILYIYRQLYIYIYTIYIYKDNCPSMCVCVCVYIYI